MALSWGLYVITDRHQALGRPLEETLREAIKGGARAFQLREKDLSAKELFELGSRLLRVTRKEGALLLINDRVDVALALGADGVHLAQSSLPLGSVRCLLRKGMQIGVSCHNLAEALKAEEGGADFITLGPIFPTPSKARYGPPLGPGIITEVRKKVSIPIFALGGIKASNVAEVMASGADGVAVISAVMGAGDVAQAVGELLIAVRAK
ncbi:MAG: thiamine phosphate synthase [candidate division NC10 bacterium]|nr:thiamine phosphate synthase [candidate division NC10 bacterium]